MGFIKSPLDRPDAESILSCCDCAITKSKHAILDQGLWVHSVAFDHYIPLDRIHQRDILSLFSTLYQDIASMPISSNIPGSVISLSILDSDENLSSLGCHD